MKNKKVLLILVAVFVTLSLCSCKSKDMHDDYPNLDEYNSEERNELSSNFDGQSEEDTAETETKVTEKEGLTLEEAKNNGEVFIKRGDLFYPITTYELKYNAYDISYYECLGYTDNTDMSKIPKFNPSDGDILVTFEDKESYNFQNIKNHTYFFPAEISHTFSEGLCINSIGIGTLNGEPLRTNGFKLLATDLEGYNLEGDNYKENIKTALKEKGAYIYYYNDPDYKGPVREKESELWDKFICSDEPTTLNYNYYSGTEYCNGSFDVNSLLFELEDDVKHSVEKTKDGYFIIETDSLNAGNTVISIGWNFYDKYILNIVK